MPIKEVKRLIVGADDSNHAGTAKGEIIVATFSFLVEDSIVRSFPNRRDPFSTSRWLDSPNRNYNYTILAGEEYRHSCQNLVVVAPKLISSFMEHIDISTPLLFIFLDGILKKGGRDNLRKQFIGFRGIERVVVDNFTKKRKSVSGRIEKHHECPSVVYHADTLANYHYVHTFEDPHFVKLE